MSCLSAGAVVARPFREVDGLELAEAERRHRTIERDGEEAARVATRPGFVGDPVRGDGDLAPGDQNDHGGVQFGLGLFEIALAAGELTIPPDRVTSRRDLLRQRLDRCAILAGVGKKDVSHAAPGRWALLWLADCS